MKLGPMKRIPITDQNLFPSNPGYARPPLPSKAYEQYEYNGNILVLYMPLERTRMNANVYCYDKIGNLRWIVEPTISDAQWSDCYSEIMWNEEHQCVALYSFQGNVVKVDMETGKISPIGFCR